MRSQASLQATGLLRLRWEHPLARVRSQLTEGEGQQRKCTVLRRCQQPMREVGPHRRDDGGCLRGREQRQDRLREIFDDHCFVFCGEQSEICPPEGQITSTTGLSCTAFSSRAVPAVPRAGFGHEFHQPIAQLALQPAAHSPLAERSTSSDSATSPAGRGCPVGAGKRTMKSGAGPAIHTSPLTSTTPGPLTLNRRDEGSTGSECTARARSRRA